MLKMNIIKWNSISSFSLHFSYKKSYHNSLQSRSQRKPSRRLSTPRSTTTFRCVSSSNLRTTTWHMRGISMTTVRRRFGLTESEASTMVSNRATLSGLIINRGSVWPLLTRETTKRKLGLTMRRNLMRRRGLYRTRSWTPSWHMNYGIVQIRSSGYGLTRRQRRLYFCRTSTLARKLTMLCIFSMADWNRSMESPHITSTYLSVLWHELVNLL